MKKTLEEVLDSLEPSELDELMPNDLNVRLSKKTLSRIEKAALEKAGLKSKRKSLTYRVWAPAAACLVLSGSLVGAACASETREYNAAMDFFIENGLSAEGLSREDVKAVYRDITTQRFSNDKTAEVIGRTVPGLDISRQEHSPEELAALWNCNINSSFRSHDTVEYNWDYKYKTENSAYGLDLEKVIVECARDGETLWKVEFPSPNTKPGDDFFVNGCVMTSAGTVVRGERMDWVGLYKHFTYSWLALIDDSGNKLWEMELDHGFDHEYLKTVLDNGDGTLAVIGEGMIFGEDDYTDHLCLTQFGADGKELGFTKTQVEKMDIRNAVRLGDGYLVQIKNLYSKDDAHIVKLDRFGNIINNFVYESDVCDYLVKDMIEFEGKVWLSAYAVPKQTDGGGRHEIANILDFVSQKGMEVTSEELTPIVRDNFTAVLLLCDPNGGEPEKFYSVKNSLGGALRIADGELQWDVNHIIQAYFSPFTSAFSISASCEVYRYTFNGSGKLVGFEDTKEMSVYAR